MFSVDRGSIMVMLFSILVPLPSWGVAHHHCGGT